MLNLKYWKRQKMIKIIFTVMTKMLGKILSHFQFCSIRIYWSTIGD